MVQWSFSLELTLDWQACTYTYK